MVEHYAVSPSEVDTKPAVPLYPAVCEQEQEPLCQASRSQFLLLPQVPHPGLLALHAPGIGADDDDGDPRWRLFAAAISPRLDHRALCHDVDRDDLKLFAFLFYFAHSDTEAETAAARRLHPFETEALVATHFALRNGRAGAEVGWVSVHSIRAFSNLYSEKDRPHLFFLHPHSFLGSLRATGIHS